MSKTNNENKETGNWKENTLMYLKQKFEGYKSDKNKFKFAEEALASEFGLPVDSLREELEKLVPNLLSKLHTHTIEELTDFLGREIFLEKPLQRLLDEKICLGDLFPKAKEKKVNQRGIKRTLEIDPSEEEPKKKSKGNYKSLTLGKLCWGFCHDQNKLNEVALRLKIGRTTLIGYLKILGFNVKDFKNFVEKNKENSFKKMEENAQGNFNKTIKEIEKKIKMKQINLKGLLDGETLCRKMNEVPFSELCTTLTEDPECIMNDLAKKLRVSESSLVRFFNTLGLGGKVPFAKVCRKHDPSEIFSFCFEASLREVEVKYAEQVRNAARPEKTKKEQISEWNLFTLNTLIGKKKRENPNHSYSDIQHALTKTFFKKIVGGNVDDYLIGKIGLTFQQVATLTEESKRTLGDVYKVPFKEIQQTKFGKEYELSFKTPMDFFKTHTSKKKRNDANSEDDDSQDNFIVECKKLNEKPNRNNFFSHNSASGSDGDHLSDEDFTPN